MNPKTILLKGELKRKVMLCKQAPDFSVHVKCEFLEALDEVLTRQEEQIKAMDHKLAECMDYMDDEAMKKVFVQPLFGDQEDGES